MMPERLTWIAWSFSLSGLAISTYASIALLKGSLTQNDISDFLFVTNNLPGRIVHGKDRWEIHERLKYVKKRYPGNQNAVYGY